MNITCMILLLHYARSDCTYPQLDAPSDIPDAHVRLVEEGLMELKPGYGEKVTKDDYHLAQYRITEKGRVYIQALMAVPVPVQAWTMPKPV